MKMTKTIQFKSLFLILLLSQPALSEIRETSQMREAIHEAAPGTLVVLDLDNTVIEAAQTLGTDQFFGFLLQNAEKEGFQGPAALERALAQASLVQPLSAVRSVEASTPRLIRDLQTRGLPVIGLTARPIQWATSTIHQLSTVGVDFKRTALLGRDSEVGADSRGRYLSGIVFMPNGGDKGEYLLDLLHRSGSPISKIIFVDDKLRNVQSVESALNKTQLTHISFRYGATDAKVKAFDSTLAAFEWSYFLEIGGFLSDEQARELMSEN